MRIIFLLFISFIWGGHGHASHRKTHYIDNDGDGYGVGVRSDHLYFYLGNAHFGNKMDLDDNDPTVNTLSSAEQKYGSFQNAGNVKRFVQTSMQLNYQVRNIYFVSNSGNDSTAVMNNINRPWKSFCSIVSRQFFNAPNAPGPRDVIILRSGIYENADVISSQCFTSNALSGAPGRPIIVMGLPEAERNQVVVNNNYWGVKIGDAQFVRFKNIVSTCVNTATNTCLSRTQEFGHVMFNIGDTNNVIVEEVESLGGMWGLWGGVSPNMNRNIIVRNTVHRDHQEHGIYIPNDLNGKTVDSTFDHNLSFRNGRTGFQINGQADRVAITNNKFFHNVVAGLSFINGVKNSYIANNVIAANSKNAIVIYADNEPVPQVKTSNDNNIFINNTVVTARFSTPRCEDGNTPYLNTSVYPCGSGAPPAPARFPAVLFWNDLPGAIHRGNTFYNNILQTYEGAAFGTNDLIHIQNTREIQNNLIYRADGNPANALMSFTTNGMHTSTTANYYYPYGWSLSSIQFGQPRIQNFANNLQGNPLFRNFLVNNRNYILFANQFNFRLRNQSPAINAGIQLQFLTPTGDIVERRRDSYPDIGAYEF